MAEQELAKPDNRWNPDNEFAFRLRNYLFPRLQGAVFLLWITEALAPATQHFPDFT